jgi:hypothetical protein
VLLISYASTESVAQTWLSAGCCDKLSQFLDSERRMHSDDERLARQFDHRDQILDRIDLQVREVRVNHYSHGNHQESVSVRLAPCCGLIAAGAGFVLDVKLLAERVR